MIDNPDTKHVAAIEQLELPLFGLRDATMSDRGLHRAERVYTNRSFSLGNIEWFGFDMDYTLAIYQQASMDALSIQATIETLIKSGYPSYLSQANIDPLFPIRGLLIDKKLGHVLKMNRFKAVRKGYHGTKPLPESTLVELYWDQKIQPDSDRYHWIDTLFGLCEVASFVGIIDAMESRSQQVNYARLFADIRRAIDAAHADGRIHNRVLADLPRFVQRDEHLASALHKLRSAGKKLFLVTNSPWPYTDAVMQYLLDSQLPEYRHWRQFFNAIVVSAKKPRWFDGDAPFVNVLDPSQGVQRLQRGEVYSAGSSQRFEKLLGTSGSSVLYLGDHIYGDILRTKKRSGWRTALILQELDAELNAHAHGAEWLREKLAVEERCQHLEEEIGFYQRRQKLLSTRSKKAKPSPSEVERTKRALLRLSTALKTENVKRTELAQSVDAAFHPYWGSLLKEGRELSSFGAQVGRYADIYMRRVSCLRHYSPAQAFRSPHDFMPHEI